MNTYVAFLRGINVGGKSTVKMEDLRSEFGKLGFLSVRTYINSGNVIFMSGISSKPNLVKVIEPALESRFGIKIKVLVRTKSEIENSILHFPLIFADPKWKHNIIFLGDNINPANLLEKYNLKHEIEKASYFEGVLYWSADLASGTRAIMYKLSAQPEYQEMTVRSIGTVNKILLLMN